MKRWKNKKRSKPPTSHPKIASNTCIVGLQIVHQLLFVCENAQATQQPLQIVDFLRIEAPNPSLPHFCPYAYLDIYIYVNGQNTIVSLIFPSRSEETSRSARFCCLAGPGIPPLVILHSYGNESLFIHWLVVLTILKNISQWEGLSHILWNKTCSKPPT
jgi:hypothetical protein